MYAFGASVSHISIPQPQFSGDEPYPRSQLSCAADAGSRIYFLDGYNSTQFLGPLRNLRIKMPRSYNGGNTGASIRYEYEVDTNQTIEERFDVLNLNTKSWSKLSRTPDFPSIAEYTATFVPSMNSILFLGGKHNDGTFCDLNAVCNKRDCV